MSCKKKKNKKGQVMDQLGGLGVGLVIFAITIIVAFLVIAEGKSTITDDISASSAANESITVSNTTAQALSFAGSSIPNTMSCTAVYNGTGGVLIGSGNYTCNNTGLLFSGAIDDWNATIDADYTYKVKSGAYNATTQLEGATEDVPGWTPLIVIAAIGGMLIGLVALYRRRQ